jgi:hypothetical protein
LLANETPTPTPTRRGKYVNSNSGCHLWFSPKSHGEVCANAGDGNVGDDVEVGPRGITAVSENAFGALGDLNLNLNME